MKTQVFKTKENHKWLDLSVPVAIVLLMVFSVFATNMDRTQYYEQGHIEIQAYPFVTNDALTAEKASAIDHAMETKLQEYLEPAVEKPLELEKWMWDEKYWSTE